MSIDPLLLTQIKEDPFAIRNMKQSPELCLEAVKFQPYALAHIQAECQTLEVICEALKIEPKVFNFVKNKISLTLTEYFKMVEANPLVLRHIPKDYQTYKMCKLALSINPNSYVHFDEKFKNSKVLSYIALTESSTNVNFLPFKLRKYLSEDVCLFLVKSDSSIIRFIPKDKITTKIIDYVVMNNSLNLKYIPLELQTPVLCLRLYKINKHVARHILIIKDADVKDNDQVVKELTELAKLKNVMELL